jgi:signal peptidase I
MERSVEKSDKVSLVDSLLDWAEIIVFALFCVVFCFTFLFRIADVHGHSMENTLFENDKLVISRLMYTPQCGDIVVVNSQTLGETIIKRVIATANQTVVINYSENTVSVDGEVLDEPYIKEKIMEVSGNFAQINYNEDSDTYEYKVPLGYVFVLGDNRNNSADSRAIGCIPYDEIVGKAVFRIYSEQAQIGKVD